jgi:hypothetical protein
VSLGLAIFVAVPSTGLIGLAGMHVYVLIRSPSPASRSVRLIVATRIAELLLTAMLLWIAALTRSLWTLAAFCVLFVAASLVRRTLRRRELAA